MIAVKAGASSVTLLSQWENMHEITKRTLQENQLETRVDVLRRSLEDLMVDVGDVDMKEEADIVLFHCDHTLLARGILTDLDRCGDDLLAKDAVIMPCSATVYGKVGSPYG